MPRLVFSADDGFSGRELWTTDGTFPLGDLWPGGGSLFPASSGSDIFAALDDGRVLFTADQGLHGADAWIIDGTGAGIHLLRDIHPGATAGYLLLSSDPGEDATAGCREPCQHACDAWLT
jgi:ELWxxDGT repeat protein